MSSNRTSSGTWSRRIVSLLVTPLVTCPSLIAQQPADVAALLAEPVITAETTQQEVKKFCSDRVPRMPAVNSADEWEQEAQRIRRDVLDKVVFRGEAARWRDAKVRVEWLDTIPGGDGYRIRKLRYEAVPGLWIPALLYEPEQIEGRVPVVLNVNGHEGQGKSIPYKQMRCINLAKRGMLALNTEWLGMGQLRTESFHHARMNQLDLCGTSGLAPFYLAMKRGLDILLAHDNADPERVAVAGLSGGGWQTIFISSLDTRVALSNPVAGYSSFLTRAEFVSDLGDSEQTPSDLATVADYTHLTALRAPRPTLLTYNAKDDCCFRADHALQPLLDAAEPIFALHGQPQNLRWHINYEPGTHNFDKENREQLYRMIGDHFAGDPGTFDAKEIACEDEVKAHEALIVPLPENNEDFHTLAVALSRNLPRQAKAPGDPERLQQWQRDRRKQLTALVHLQTGSVTAEAKGSKTAGDIQATYWRLKLENDWTVPAVELQPAQAKGTAILVADAGRTEAAAQVSELLKSGCRVVAIDPFYFGESKIKERDYLYALLVAGVGERPLGLQAGQIVSVAAWLQDRSDGAAPGVVAVGPRLSTAALVAAALAPECIASLELYEPLGSLKQVIESNWTVQQYPELFCFGLLERFDLASIATLVAPREIIVHGGDERAMKWGKRGDE